MDVKSHERCDSPFHFSLAKYAVLHCLTDSQLRDCRDLDIDFLFAQILFIADMLHPVG